MHTFDNDPITRTDVHPLAVVETDDPMMECATCGLPTDGDIYCNAACENAALEEAMWADAIAEAKIRIEDEEIFAAAFPDTVEATEVEMIEEDKSHCSCCQ